jgi:hypothetical protein
MLLLASLLMASASAKPSESLIPGAEDFDLKRVKRSGSCADRGLDAIVVCARRTKSDEIFVRDPGRFESGPLRAETRIGGGILDVHGEQHGLPDGRSAPAAMVRFRIPF